MLRIESLEIDDHILEKIEVKHHIKFEEVEATCLCDQRHVRRQGDLYKVFGRSAAGRYILVALANKGESHWKVATARQMTNTEKKLYDRTIGGK
jgi:uncharacterized DUF497 family protein